SCPSSSRCSNIRISDDGLSARVTGYTASTVSCLSSATTTTSTDRNGLRRSYKTSRPFVIIDTAWSTSSTTSSRSRCSFLTRTTSASSVPSHENYVLGSRVLGPCSTVSEGRSETGIIYIVIGCHIVS